MRKPSIASVWSRLSRRPQAPRALLTILVLALALSPGAHAQCPNHDKTTLTIDQVLQLSGSPAGVEVQKFTTGQRAEITFLLQSAHAFLNPDPAGCSGEGISMQSSINISSFQTIFLDDSTAIVSVTPQSLSVRDMSLDFKVAFHQNYNLPPHSLVYKKKFCTLVIPFGDMANEEIRYISPSDCS